MPLTDGASSALQRSGVMTLDMMIDRIKTRTNETWIVPTCQSRTRLTHPTQESGNEDKFDIRVRQGSIRVFNSAGSVDPNASTFYPTFQTTYAEADEDGKTKLKESGIRMLQRSYNKVAGLVKSKYGSPDATEHVYVVFNVRPSPGVPGGKWIYT